MTRQGVIWALILTNAVVGGCAATQSPIQRASAAAEEVHACVNRVRAKPEYGPLRMIGPADANRYPTPEEARLIVAVESEQDRECRQPALAKTPATLLPVEYASAARYDEAMALLVAGKITFGEAGQRIRQSTALERQQRAEWLGAESSKKSSFGEARRLSCCRTCSALHPPPIRPRRCFRCRQHKHLNSEGRRAASQIRTASAASIRTATDPCPTAPPRRMTCRPAPRCWRRSHGTRAWRSPRFGLTCRGQERPLPASDLPGAGKQSKLLKAAAVCPMLPLTGGCAPSPTHV